MLRPSSRIAMACGIAGMLSGVVLAQNDRHGQYLDDLGLQDVHAEFLLDRLDGAAGQDRIDIAQRLALVYLDLLQDDSVVGERQQWAERAATLLRVVPEADSASLRLGLAQAAFVKAEQSAERHVLLLASEREVADAERILREVAPTFVGLAQQAHRDAERLERELSKPLGREEEDAVAEQLAEARRIRSIAFYFAGWSSYYAAELTGNRAEADQALRHFGWILGARDGSSATVDQLQASLLRFEHVSRSAVGAAMASSLTGRTLEARAWLDAVAKSTEVPSAIRETLPARRVRVLAAAEAWPDVDTIARRAFGSQSEPASPAFARLVCILAMERSQTPGAKHGQLVRRLAEDATAYLVTTGEIGHVTDLARRFGIETLGTTGFVANYVRATMQWEEARQAAERFGSDDARSIVAMLEAAERLASSTSAEDAEQFPVERARGLFQAGQALLEAGKLSEASEIFERCQALAPSEDQRRQAAWMRVVTLERAVDAGDASLANERDQSALLFLAAYPASDESAQLALRPSTARLLTEGQAIDILLAVPRSAPTYGAARRRASALLYLQYRAAGQIERPLIAARFMVLAEELIAQGAVELRSVEADGAEALAEAVVLNARRLADVALALDPPEIERAVFALETVDRVAAYSSHVTDAIQDELTFRRLQIASAYGEIAEAASLAAELAERGSSFASTASRVLYRDSVRVWLERPSDLESSRRVVRFGEAIRDSLSDRPGALASVLQTVAQAADVAAESEANLYMPKAKRAREALVAMGMADAQTLRLLASGYSDAGEYSLAAETWLGVLQQAEPNSMAWYEARLESLRALEKSNRQVAADAARQFRALHPDYGPRLYRSEFRDIVARLVGEEGP